MTISIEQRARRVAHKAGLLAKKSRWRRDRIDNYGGSVPIDGNTVVAGARYDWTADEVMRYCQKLTTAS